MKKNLCTKNLGYMSMQENEYANNKIINDNIIYIVDIPIKID